MGYTRLKPRKWSDKQDEKKRAEFRTQVQILIKQPKTDLWFCDECGVKGNPVPRKILALKGSRPRIVYNGSHIRSSVIGAVRPQNGKLVSLIMPYVDYTVFQIFLDEMQKRINKKNRNIIFLDNAQWHKKKELKWGRLEPYYLPVYSPDFNPIEELWLSLKTTFFTWFWTDIHDELDDHLEMALKYFMDRPDTVKSICSMGNFG